jgi:hypothetical protein
MRVFIILSLLLIKALCQTADQAKVTKRVALTISIDGVE